MIENNHPAPPLNRLVRKTLGTVIGAIGNRGELFMVEAQEERERTMQLVFRSVVALFLAMLGLLLFTATIIFLFPSDDRVYAAGAFTLVYLAASAGIFLSVKNLLKQEPFSETLAQLRKDRDLIMPSND